MTATQILDIAIATATGFDAAPHAFDAYAERGELRFVKGSPLHGAVIALRPGSPEPIRMSGLGEAAEQWAAVVVEAMNEAA